MHKSPNSNKRGKKEAICQETPVEELFLSIENSPEERIQVLRRMTVLKEALEEPVRS